MTAIASNPENNRLREAVNLTLPKEHGSWSLALEPLGLAILVAPSAAGGALLVAAVAGFFLRRPLKLVLPGKPDPRISPASTAIIALSIIAATSFGAAAAFGGTKNLWPLIPAAVAGVGFAWFDSRNESREAAAELCGAIAFSILPMTFAVLAGWSVVASAALAAMTLVRSVPTVLYIRTYLRRNKGHSASSAPAFTTAAAGFLLAGWLAISHRVPWPAAILALLLAVRTFCVLGSNRRFTAKEIGIVEMSFGIAMVVVLAVAWRFFKPA